MVHTREDLGQLTAGDISGTMSCIHTVQEFCDRYGKWLLQRESELKRMRDIRDRAEKINLTTDHFLKSKTKMKAFWEYVWSKVTKVTARKRAQKLEKELGCLLQDTLEGLEKLTQFLQAVEMLAVTSLSVFEEENPVCQLPEGVSADAVRSVITAARGACPLLIHFQRDDGKFFRPSLVNVDLLAFQLDKYLRLSQELCEKLQKREEPDQLAAGYISGTMSCIHTVQEFCDIHSKWLLQRETELKRMRDIRDRAVKINLTTDHYKKSKNKPKAFREFMWSKVTKVTAGKRAQMLEKELGCLLQDTLKGLEKLTPFLQAVEMLAVTSLSVFEEENPVCQLPEGVSADAVRSVITAARGACPLLIHFKRDDGEFFQTSLVNVDLLAFQLDKYLRVSQELCEKLQKRTKKAPCPNLTNEAIQNMYEHLTDLTSIRLDRHFRMTYLFRGSAQGFIGLFSHRCSRMQQFLVALEEEAVQLDRMKMRASISRVAGNSVGFVGGIVSIAGLALVPVTAGASLTLTMVSTGLVVTSVVNSFVSGTTELLVNTHHGKKINKIFQSYFEDVETMLECLEQAARCIICNMVPDGLDVPTVVEKATKTACSVREGIKTIVDCASAKKVLRAKELASTSNAARNVPNRAADLTDLGQLAKGTPLALSKYARVGSIALNSFFIGMDLYLICKDSISLANGDKSEVSRVIREKASLWKTELDAWEKILHSLCIGRLSFEMSEKVLQRPFYT
ncbi:uncharacterized protein LOC133114973 [Conger conger]|uniref:uncharacterized protein LOC133114973 n=1 Tax=Conger conger TaxID=82655 RepID=UPI002A5A2AB7|nr:uncharacterized protein LOC133114973 [Conger conger]